MIYNFWRTIYPLCTLQLDVLLVVGMDADLYDEFGNYIGPELESDEEEEEGYGDREPEAQEYDVSYSRDQHLSFV